MKRPIASSSRERRRRRHGCCLALLFGLAGWSALLQPPLLVLAAAPASGATSIVAKKYPKFTSDEELAEFYSQNLELDFAFHRQGPQYTLADIHKAAVALNAAWRPEYRFLAVVKNGVMRVAPIPGHAATLAATRVKCQVQNSQFAIEHKAPFPDTIFLLNIWDQPVCKVSAGRSSPCHAPIMSVYKDAKGHADLLIPHPCYKYEDLRQYPWDRKIPKAFMRASVYGSMPINCTRVMLYNVSLSPRGKKWLDVGIVTNQHHELALPIAERVPMYEHPKWKYLINGDGVVASSRLGSLLGMDSVILKSHSPSVEYYYRSLTPGVQYVPFKTDGSDILDVVEELERKEPAELQRVANEARAFQQKYLNRYAKTLYMRKVLNSYNDLFAPNVIASFVAGLDEDKLSNTSYLMQQLKAAAANPSSSSSSSSSSSQSADGTQPQDGAASPSEQQQQQEGDSATTPSSSSSAESAPTSSPSSSEQQQQQGQEQQQQQQQEQQLDGQQQQQPAQQQQEAAQDAAGQQQQAHRKVLI